MEHVLLHDAWLASANRLCVRLSVRHTPKLCDTDKHIKRSSPPGSLILSVFMPNDSPDTMEYGAWMVSLRQLSFS